MANKNQQKKSKGHARRRTEENSKSGEKKVPTTDPSKELDPRIH